MNLFTKKEKDCFKMINSSEPLNFIHCLREWKAQITQKYSPVVTPKAAVQFSSASTYSTAATLREKKYEIKQPEENCKAKRLPRTQWSSNQYLS